MKIELVGDDSIRLQADELLTTTEVETPISDLAEVRGNMSPPVSDTRPTGEGQRISVQDSPPFKAVVLRQGGIRLYLRNAGLGWLAFTLDGSQVAALKGVLDLAAEQQDAGPNLVDLQVTDLTRH